MTVSGVGETPNPYSNPSGLNEQSPLLRSFGESPPTIAELKEQISEKENQESELDFKIMINCLNSIRFRLVEMSLRGAHAVTLGLGIATLPLIPVGIGLIYLSSAYKDSYKMVKQKANDIDTETKKHKKSVKEIQNELKDLNKALKEAVEAEKAARDRLFQDL